MKLYDLLTPEELKRIRKNETIRNCDIKDITVEELQIMPLDSQTSNGLINTHGGYVLDELLFRQSLRTKPEIAAHANA